MQTSQSPLNFDELTELDCHLRKVNRSVSYLHGLLCAVISSPNMIMPSPMAN